MKLSVQASFSKTKTGINSTLRQGKPRFLSPFAIDKFKMLTITQVCHTLGAKLLIDDSVENALTCAKADPPITVLLFGDYQWNKRESRLDHPQDHLGYKERLEFEHGREWWKDESVELPSIVTRMKDWKEVVTWVEKNKEQV